MFCNSREGRGLGMRISRRQKDSSKPLLENIDGATAPDQTRIACMPQYDRLRWIYPAYSKTATMTIPDQPDRKSDSSYGHVAESIPAMLLNRSTSKTRF
jgi:hypothetical protein